MLNIKNMTYKMRSFIIATSFFVAVVPALAIVVYSEDFSSYFANGCLADGSTFGPWTVVFAGFGCVEIESDGANQWLHMVPKVPKGGNTHSALVVGPSFSSTDVTGPFTYEVKLHTIDQTRAGSRK